MYVNKKMKDLVAGDVVVSDTGVRRTLVTNAQACHRGYYRAETSFEFSESRTINLHGSAIVRVLAK